MKAASGQKRSSTENELMSSVDLITNPKVRAYILKKKQQKEELKRFRQSGGERGLAARKARGIHGKLDLDEESELDEDMMNDVASSDEEEEQKVKEVVKAVAKVKAPKKLTGKKIKKWLISNKNWL